MFGKKQKSPYPRREYKKRVVEGLKGGCGTVTIYVAKKRHEAPEVYEWGYLVLSVGGSIGNHQHTDDEEIWECEEGVVEYKDTTSAETEILDKYSGERICPKGHFHYLRNLGSCEAVIRFRKFR